MGRTSKFQVLSSPSISVSVDYSTSLSFGDRLKDVANKRESTPAAVADNAAHIAPKLKAISIPDFSEGDDIEVLECRSQRRLFEEDEYDGRKNRRYNFRMKLQPLQRFNPAQAIPRKKSKEEKQRRRELEDDAGTPLRAYQMPSKGSVLDGEDDFQHNADRPQEQEKELEGNGENVLEPAGHNQTCDWPQQNEQKMQTCQLYEEKRSNCQEKSMSSNHRERSDDGGFDDDLMIIDSIQASSSSPASKRKSPTKGNPQEHDRQEKSIGENGLEGADEPCDWPQQKSLLIDESKLADNDVDEDDDFMIIDSIQASPSFPASKSKKEPKQQKRTSKSKEPKVSRTSKSKESKVSRTSKSKKPKVSKTGSKIKEPKISRSSGFREPNANKLPKPSKSKFKKMRLQDMLSRINDSLSLQVEPLKEKKLGDVARQMTSTELTNQPVNAEPVEKKRPSKPVSAHSEEPVYMRPLNSKPVSTHERQNAVHLEPPKPARKPETSDRLPCTHEQPDAVHMKAPKLVQRPESASLRASIIRPDDDRESKRTSHLEHYSCGSSSNLRTDVHKSSPLSSKNAYSPIHKAFARDYNDPIWSNLRQDFSLPFAVGRKRKPVQETSNDAGKCKKAERIDMRKEEEQKSYRSSQPAVGAPQVKKECSEDPELIAACELNEFSTKLEEVLKKPFSRSELFEKLSHVRCQKPIVRSRDLRERSISFSTEKDGPSYLDYYPDFAELLNSASEKEERLKLLRGFLFWIEHACMAGSFQPWIKVRTRETEEEEDCFQLVSCFRVQDGLNPL